MRNCPKCGHPVEDDTTKCPNCGQILAVTKAPVTSVVPPKPHRWLPWVVGIVLILLIGGLGVQMSRQHRNAKPQVTQTTKTKAKHSSKTSQASANKASTNQALANKLDGNDTAAAILYYGATKLNNQDFKNGLKTTQNVKALNVTVQKITSNQHLDHAGQGIIYTLTPGKTASPLRYTLDQDQKVNFYVVKDNNQYNYLGSVAWHDLVTTINQQHGGNTVRQIGKFVKVQENK